MEENRRFSWSDLFIKVILVIIFVLFTVWLLSLSNKKMTNSLDVLTDQIFAENIDKMKEVGKSYFTIERLPEKVGEIEVLTLEKMYEKKLILELKDKNGHACSAKDSYVSIEKFENEYQMKVYLECGNASDYVIVIMGCYDYCDADICEKQEVIEKEEEYIKGEVPSKIEYEYKKTTDGKWTDYGTWSEWSKVTVTETDYRQVEIKKENEEYTYNKTVTERLFEVLNAECPSGYKKTTDGLKCYKENTTNLYENPTCPSVDGYTLSNQNGFTCNYSKTTTDVKDPVCPSKSGWNLTRSGFTCNYSRTVEEAYETTEEYTGTCYSTKKVIPCTGCAPVSQRVPYSCTKTRTVTKYRDVEQTDTATATCSTGYNKSENNCVKTETVTTSKDAVCPSGYNKSGSNCVKNNVSTISKDAVCPSGYSKSGSNCVKTNITKDYKELIKSCPAEYKLDVNQNKCYKDVEKTVEVTGIREVTYYRYRIREYVGGTVDYKWSTSKNDKNLLDAGYKLTGKTR